jgi:hypothetical protein
MEQVPKSVPSYWTRRRKIKADVAAFFESAGHLSETNVSRQCTSDDHRHENTSCLGPETCFDSSLDHFNTQDSNLATGISNCDIDACSWLDDDNCTRFSDSDSDSDKDDNDNMSVRADTASDNDIVELGLRIMLALWATQHEITNVAINALLHILRKYHSNLPLDSRSLLSTPRNTGTKNLANGGQYIHFGLKHGIEELVNSGDIASDEKHLKLQFNVDGLPLFKSSGMCIWPILCLVLQSYCNEPFVVGIFCGMSKPADLNEFFADFIDECKHVVDNGIQGPNSQNILRQSYILR